MKVQRVLAPNPSSFTGPGTNTWVVSSGGQAVVIDPGPEIPEHLSAIREALYGFEPVAVLVTHAHPDHAPAAEPLARTLGVPAIGSAPGPGFRPDRRIADGDSVDCGEMVVVAVATPGHTADSMSYRIDGALFTGDHIMGGSTVIVEDMSDYLTSLRVLLDTGLRVIYPGHGPVIEDPDATIAEYLAHRLEREAQILLAVEKGAGTVGEVVESVYVDVDPSLHGAAALSVNAHLRKLAGEGAVRFPSPGDGWEAAVEPVA
jgi:glyoxylase-like metal-dependent hydrolase (beta-lactamase superfamily II)